MVGNGVAHRGEVVDPERGDPVGKARRQRPQGGIDLSRLAECGLRRSVARVGRHDRVRVHPQDRQLVAHPVQFVDGAVGGMPVGSDRRTRRLGSDVEFVEEGDEAVDVGGRSLHRVDERPGVERRVDVGDVPAGEHLVGRSGRLLERGHGLSEVEVDVGDTSATNAALVQWIRNPSRS